jgi:hypothetical protein
VVLQWCYSVDIVLLHCYHNVVIQDKAKVLWHVTQHHIWPLHLFYRCDLQKCYHGVNMATIGVTVYDRFTNSAIAECDNSIRAVQQQCNNTTSGPCTCNYQKWFHRFYTDTSLDIGIVTLLLH